MVGRPSVGWADEFMGGKKKRQIHPRHHPGQMYGKVAWRGREKNFTGTGLIPREDIGDATWKRGVPNLADTIRIEPQSGGWSSISLKSYEQGRGSFEGTDQDVVWPIRNRRSEYKKFAVFA